MTCPECNDTRTTYRPVSIVERSEVVTVFDPISEQIDDRLETTYTQIGGIDACPYCTQWAESNYRALYGEGI